MMIDLELVIYLMVFAMVFGPMISFVASWAMGRSRAYILKANDAHQALFRKLYKSARTNLKATTGIRPTRLYFEGDEDFYGQDHGKIKGLIWTVHAVHVFYRPWGSSMTRWGVVQKELIRDPLSRNLRICANGMIAKGNFYVPVYSSIGPDGRQLTEVDVRRLDNIWKSIEKQLLLDEKSIEIEEQKVHAIPDSLRATKEASRVINRDDHLQRVETNEPRRDDVSEEF